MNYIKIEACVAQAKRGNREDLLKVLEQYKPFIYKTAAQFNIKNYDTQDLVQIGYIYLINAVSKYKTGSNTFGTYAYNSIKNALRYTARQNTKFDTELSLNVAVASDTDTNTEFIECLESEENIEADIVKSENIKELRKALSNLPAEEIELVHMVYYNECSLKNYSDKKGLKYLHAVRKNKVLEKLGGYVN